MDRSIAIIQHAKLLSDSFLRLTGKPLIDGELKEAELLDAIYKAPFVVVSHGTEEDPIFNFANLKAQKLWEINWEDFIQTPSRLSAEPVSQSERQKILDQAQQQGYISEYNGIRISKSGKKFYILNTTLWNVTDAEGNYKGQAAMFKEWRFIG